VIEIPTEMHKGKDGGNLQINHIIVRPLQREKSDIVMGM
jgi:hypothetical protein